MSREVRPPVPQACAIPFRWTAGRAEVCLVTTIKKRRWIFPKGLVERGELPEKTALHEAWEEAGLRGHISGDAVGSYKFEKCGVNFLVTCFLMQVSRQSRSWHESRLRERMWLPLDQALRALGRDEQRKVFAAARKLIERQKKRRAG